MVKRREAGDKAYPPHAHTQPLAPTLLGQGTQALFNGELEITRLSEFPPP